MALRLICKASKDSWVLEPGTYSIGRGENCKIQVRDPMVSRSHALLTVKEDNSVELKDLGSTNGVFVGRKRVLKSYIDPGDSFRLGPVEFQLIQEDVDQAHESTIQTEKSQGDLTVIERGVISGAPTLDSARLQVLYDVVEAIVGNLSIKEILPTILDILDKLFSYDRCTIALQDSEGRLVTQASRPEWVRVPYSKTIVKRVLEKGLAVLYDDVQDQASFELSESIMGLNIRSVICSPLDFHGEIRGLVYLDRSIAGAYSVEDLALLRSVSHLVAIALENARLYGELEERYEQKAEALKEVQRRLVQSERAAALGRLAQSIAHELRNPLMVIGGITRKVKRALEEKGVSEADELEMVMQEAHRMERMMRQVDQLISLPEPRPRLCPLEDAVERAMERERQEMPGDIEIKLVSRLNRRPVPHDPALTELAINSVLQNAILAAKRDKGLFVILGQSKEGWHIDVADVFKDQIDDQIEFRGIFDRFFSSHPWAIDLGLTLAQRAMALQGGDLKVATEGIEGNLVRLTIYPQR